MATHTIIRQVKLNFLWILYALFAVFAVYSRQDPYIFESQGPYGLGKYLVWGILILFLIYSLYASTKENFLKTLSKMAKLYWGRQIGLDLYIGLLLPLTIIYFNGGIVILLIWILPVLIYANLATLLFIALNYDTLISQFLL